MTNEQRAAMGRTAFEQYAATPGFDTGEARTTFTDLLADMLHFAASQGWDVEAVTAKAMSDYSYEVDPDNREEVEA